MQPGEMQLREMQHYNTTPLGEMKSGEMQFGEMQLSLPNRNTQSSIYIALPK
ncbi:hypothetical protein H8356DRAFT_1331389 [Neocallimastix lanati (nom. inval.)]|nr:hypothetical protein H8356DRAFT_1331389 [Neocallimastix sp. JGI-2020a]